MIELDARALDELLDALDELAPEDTPEAAQDLDLNDCNDFEVTS